MLLVGFVVLAGASAGAISVRSPTLGALAVLAALGLVLVARQPVMLAVVATGAVFAVQRLGAHSVTPGRGISYSDALLAAAFVLALPALVGSAELHRLRVAGWGTALYLALLLPGVIANPSTGAYLEWLHRLVLVGGSLLVGALLAREERIRTALRLLTLVACVVAGAAVADTLSNGFAAASPLSLNKNFIGALFSSVVIVLLVAPRVVGLSARIQVPAVLLVGCGLLASQSRGAMLGAVAGLLVTFALVRRLHNRRTVVLATLVGVAFAVLAGLSLHSQFQQDTADLNNSSVGVRSNVEAATHDLWLTSPVVGVGLKYFTTGQYGRLAVASTNVVNNELAESGVFGLLGFVLLQIAAVGAALRRRRDPLLVAAAGAVVGQLAHGMVDIYWSAGTAALPFLLLGMGLARAPADSRAPADEGQGRRASGS